MLDAFAVLLATRVARHPVLVPLPGTVADRQMRARLFGQIVEDLVGQRATDLVVFVGLLHRQLRLLVDARGWFGARLRGHLLLFDEVQVHVPQRLHVGSSSLGWATSTSDCEPWRSREARRCRSKW